VEQGSGFRVQARNEGNEGLRKLVERELRDGCTSGVTMEAELKVKGGRAKERYSQDKER
jgi:hypothetical protein